MRRCSITMLFAALLGLGSPVRAQEQAAPADPDTIQFDLGEVEDDGEDWGISSYLAARDAAQGTACTTASDSDLLAAQSTSRPRYDDNGALIREAPSTCAAQSPRASSAASASSASATGRLAFLRQPDCEESASGYRCSSAGTAGRNTYEREQVCEETGNTRTCSSSFSIGNSTEGRNAAQEAIDRLRDD